MQRVEVDTGESGYDIYIGSSILSHLKDFLRKNSYSQNALLVTDSNVGRLYARPMENVLRDAGLNPVIYQVKAGESSKSLAVAEDVFSRCIESSLDRNSLIIALGGGVVGDLTGFVAATYMRGVPFIQLPASLLAQVDSSVGGKVAVNHRLGKNLIGAFYQPEAVFIDLNFLQSLPKREIYTGLGEIVKYGAIYDAEFMDFLAGNTEKILSLDKETIEKVIARSCTIKAEVVSKDEKESGLRRILNFGHTVGHAIEKETRYLRYNHGEAVAIGMRAAAIISCRLGLIGPEVRERLIGVIKSFHLPVSAEGCRLDNIINDLFHDKKTVNGKINWVLINGIGSTVIRDDVPLEIVRETVEECLIC